jgi:hypothetical protein
LAFITGSFREAFRILSAPPPSPSPSDRDRGERPLLDLGSRGKVVAFDSAATNLVSGDTNEFDDVFVRGSNK